MNLEHDLWLELSIPTEWERIDQVREAVESSLGAVFGTDDGTSEMLSMVSTELLENAVKYGSTGQNVRFKLHSDPEVVTVSVMNHVGPESNHARTLVERIAWLQTFGDPREAYAATLQRVYANVGSEADSGLGIARIFHEGQCSLACDRSSPDTVTVTARWSGPTLGA